MIYDLNSIQTVIVSLKADWLVVRPVLQFCLYFNCDFDVNANFIMFSCNDVREFFFSFKILLDLRLLYVFLDI